jgi:hypothetical protein
VPLTAAWLTAPGDHSLAVTVTSLLLLALLGALAAVTGGASVGPRRAARDILGRSGHGLTAWIGSLAGMIL